MPKMAQIAQPHRPRQYQSRGSGANNAQAGLAGYLHSCDPRGEGRQEGGGGVTSTRRCSLGLGKESFQGKQLCRPKVQTVQKSAKSEPGIKHRTVSADVSTVVEPSLLSLRTSMDDMGPMGRRSKPGSPVPGSPKRGASGPLKAAPTSRAPSGRTTLSQAERALLR
jgi:hypothetical protein